MLCCYGRSVTLLRSDEGYWAGHILVIRNRDHGNNDVTGGPAGYFHAGTASRAAASEASPSFRAKSILKW